MSDGLLPDLRVTIAESMAALAWSLPVRPIRTQAEHRRLMAGAETLRWCARYEDEREAPDLIAEIQRLEGILGEINGLAEPKAADYRAGVAKALESW